MRAEIRPRVVVSRCIEFDRCRYNGDMISSDVVRALKKHVDFEPVCAEVEIGLGVPRDPIRVATFDGELRLVQPSTELDVTDRMKSFAASYLASVGVVDGFLLKSRSPSCGIKDVKVFPGLAKQAAVARGAGFFGAAVLERFAGRPVEDEARLTNFRIREHYLTALWALARFRAAREAGGMRDLVDFHSRNKLLLMAYNQTAMRSLGRVVANPEHKGVAEAFAAYEAELRGALAKPSRFTSNINVLMHALGYFSDGISPSERKHFLGALERYRAEKIPLSAAIAVVTAWLARFDVPYLAQQTFFEPYPEELVEITDSGKGRDL
jgi:uncharacterized protein YbgA (DUF1722 family)/uncharacterized protein YbbK (DUF523 family)